MATHDNSINVTILSTPGAVAAQDFGTPIYITDALEAGFTQRVRTYETNSAAQADADLQAATKSALAQAFSQEPRVRRIKVGRINYALTIADELDAILAEDDEWYGLAASSRVQATVEAIAAWTEANDRLYSAQTSDATVLSATGGNVAENLQAALYGRTFLSWHSDDVEHIDLCWLAMKLAADPDEVTTIWRHATLSGIAAQDDNVDDTQKGNIDSQSANVYLTFKKIPATGKGVLSDGLPIDTRISKDWTEARIGERVAQLLINESNLNQKIPYTDAGISQVSSTVQSVFTDGETVGHFRPGSSSLDIPKLEDVPAPDVAGRILNLTGTTILAGAIEEVDVTVSVLLA